MLLDSKQVKQEEYKPRKYKIKQEEYKPRKYKRKMSITAKLWIAFLIDMFLFLAGAFCLCIPAAAMLFPFFSISMVVTGIIGLMLGAGALSFTLFGED